MTAAAAQIQEILAALQSSTEREKIARRLPADSGLEPIGVRMKDVFDTAKAWTDLDIADVPSLLTSPLYEVRMVGVSVLDFKARSTRLSSEERRELYDAYLDHHEFITVWDFVDRAAPRVVGGYLLDRSRAPLFDLARSTVPIRRRTAITAAFWWIRHGDLDDPLALAGLLLDDPSELVTRPVGTALREVGKIDESRLLEFLAIHRGRISNPTLRLATERLRSQ